MPNDNKEAVKKTAFSLLSDQTEPRSAEEELKASLNDLNELINFDQIMLRGAKQKRQTDQGATEQTIVNLEIDQIIARLTKSS